MDTPSIVMLPEIKYHYFFSSFGPDFFFSPITIYCWYCLHPCWTDIALLFLCFILLSTTSEHPLVSGICPSFRTRALIMVLINYIDTKVKCLYLKNLHLKGLCGRCLSELRDWRYSQSCWYFRPSFVNCCPSFSLLLPSFSLVQLSLLPPSLCE